VSESRRARAFEVVVYASPLPALSLMLGQSPAEADFLDLQRNPQRRQEWREHCAGALKAWHERTGVPVRSAER